MPKIQTKLLQKIIVLISLILVLTFFLGVGSARAAGPVCGNNITEPGEACDGSDINNLACSGLPGYKSGSLSCSADCKTYNVVQCVPGKTINAASCERVDVQTAYNKAAAGDIVAIPAGNCDWTTPNFIIDKAITLRGAGHDATIINADRSYSSLYPIDTIIDIRLNADVPVRITDINFRHPTNNLGARSVVVSGKRDGSFPYTKIRIDNNKFEKGTRAIFISGWVEGVINHNTFLNCNIGVGVSGDNNHSWTRPIETGTQSSLFIEDNTFVINNATDQEPNQQVYLQEGARTVTRHNMFDGSAYTNGNSVLWDSHGNQTLYKEGLSQFRGQPIIELYENTFLSYKTYEILNIRGGSILMFNNKMVNQINNPYKILLKEEEAWESGGQFGAPPPAATQWNAQDQIINSFFWNNTYNESPITDVSLKFPGVETEFIQKDRDYFMHAPEATGGKATYNGRSGGAISFSTSGANAYYPYIPYPYPHPLVANPTPSSIFYVDQNHPDSSDANPGTEALPWQTIAHAATLAKAGNTIIVKSGDYTGASAPGNVVISASGTAQSPIVFRADPISSVTTYSFRINGDYTTIQGFNITQKNLNDFDGIRIDGNHAIVKDNYFFNIGGTSAIKSYWSTTPSLRASFAHIVNNRIYRCQYGIFNEGDNWLIEGNEIESLVKYTFELNDDADYMRLFGENHIIRNNYLHDTLPADINTAHVDCFQTYDNNYRYIKDAVIENNICFDFNQGFMGEGYNYQNSSNILFRKNIFSGGRLPASGMIIKDIPYVTIVHNIFMNIQNGGGGISLSRDRNNLTKYGRILNNIFYKVAQKMPGDSYNVSYVYWNPKDDPTFHYADYNLMAFTKPPFREGDWSNLQHGPNEIIATLSPENFTNIVTDVNALWSWLINRSYVKNDGTITATIHRMNNASEMDIMSVYEPQRNAIYAVFQNAIAVMDPLFVNSTDIAGTDSLARTDDDGLQLKVKSPAIDKGTALTVAVGSGSGTLITVQDTRYFHDGKGLTDGDLIKVGGNEPARITSIDYTRNSIVIDRPISWSANEPVSYSYTGNAPDIGAYEYKDSAPDNEAPSIPANFTATAISSTQINLTWTQSTDNTAVTNYKIYRNSQLINSLNSLTYSDTGLTANTAYTYSVSAIDGSSNESEKSTEVSATTLSFGSSDLNQDQKVNSLDFEILKLNWNKTDKPKSDINQDGMVNTKDLGIMMSEWGG